MLLPAVLSWIEERDKVARVGIMRRNVRPLEPVAAKAGVRKILQCGCPAMLLANNVVRLMGNKCRSIRDSAILAAVFSTPHYRTAQGGRYRRHASRRRAGVSLGASTDQRHDIIERHQLVQLPLLT